VASFLIALVDKLEFFIQTLSAAAKVLDPDRTVRE
jgi:hypothetical protein